MNLRDGIPEPLNDLCIALHGLGGETAETRAAEVIRVLAEALMRYEQYDNLSSAFALEALAKACVLAVPPAARPPKALPRPSAKTG